MAKIAFILAWAILPARANFWSGLKPTILKLSYVFALRNRDTKPFQYSMQVWVDLCGYNWRSTINFTTWCCSKILKEWVYKGIIRAVGDGDMRRRWRRGQRGSGSWRNLRVRIVGFKKIYNYIWSSSISLIWLSSTCSTFLWSLY